MIQKRGITQKDASKLLAQYGPNEIIVKRSRNTFAIFFSQFQSFLILLLLLAAVTSFLFHNVVDGIFILVIVLLNSLLGFAQEYRAERAVAALKKLATSTTRVIRDGVEREIDSRLLVPGDVIKIEEGDKVPADAKLLAAINLEVNEASLTGESLPVFKKEDEEEHSRLFLGTIVVKGRGEAIVEAIGMRTRFGSIATGLSEIIEPPTPLAQQLTNLGTRLAFIAIFSSALVFLFGFLRGQELLTLFLTSVSLAVAAVPEGLPAVITITLAVGMHRMAKARAIARKMAAIETLGAATIIATDKTGTITKNEMRVREVFVDGKNFELTTHNKQLTTGLRELLRIGVIANTASLVFKHPPVGGAGFDVIGDPTEGALLLLAHELGVNPDELKKDGELLDEFSFDAKRKTMSVIFRHAGDKKGVFVYVKGAPEAVLERSSMLLMEGEEVSMTKIQRQSIEDAFQDEANKGFRIIAMARKKVESGELKVESLTRDEVESELTFIGFAALSDPPRPEVKDAAKISEAAGIRTIIITGDNELTANAVATEAGLIKKGEDILTGSQLEQLSDEELLKILPNIRIFARTTPEHKFRIVKAYQRLGHIVAVTGDGVNDALALKQANVGIAMGITGTDVAREAADFIVADDNYASIVKAIEEGRVIFDNIMKSVVYLASGNLGELLTIFVAVVIGLPSPLVPVQILWINLVTDGLPALALAVDPKDPGVMKRKPRSTTQSILHGGNIAFIVAVGSAIAGLVLLLFTVSLLVGSEAQARTIAFTTLILFHISIAFLVRKNHSASWRMFSNRFLVISIAVVVFLQLLILLVPALHPIFKVSPLW